MGGTIPVGYRGDRQRTMSMSRLGAIGNTRKIGFPVLGKGHEMSFWYGPIPMCLYVLLSVVYVFILASSSLYVLLS